MREALDPFADDAIDVSNVDALSFSFLLILLEEEETEECRVDAELGSVRFAVETDRRWCWMVGSSLEDEGCL